MWLDLFTALTVLPWLIPLGFFTFIFLEWSSRDRGAQEALRLHSPKVWGDPYDVSPQRLSPGRIDEG